MLVKALTKRDERTKANAESSLGLQNKTKVEDLSLGQSMHTNLKYRKTRK
jgi:hypothetical protein